MDGGRYTPDERAAIEDKAPRPLTDADWQLLEDFAAAYCATLPWLTKTQAGDTERLAKRLAGKLGPGWSPEISRWRQALHELEGGAHSRHCAPRKGNRSHLMLDAYLSKVIGFYAGAGGHPGKAIDSLCSRFVMAVATPVVVAAATRANLKARSVSRLIRARIRFLSSGLSVEKPTLGDPKLDAGGCKSTPETLSICQIFIGLLLSHLALRHAAI